MLSTLAVENYRSIKTIVMPLTRLNVIAGANGSGKSNLYRALRLLASAADTGIAAPLAREGGLASAMWAGPANDISGRMRRGETPVQGRAVGGRTSRLRLGFGGDDYGYAVSMGMAGPGGPSAFSLDPEFKQEAIWAGPFLRSASMLVERTGNLVRRRAHGGWDVLTSSLPRYESLFSHVGKDAVSPEVFAVREQMRGWRFYDHFPTDAGAPARQPQIGTRTPVLSHDGWDLAAALQTIREIGDVTALDRTVSDAFPDAAIDVQVSGDRFFSLIFHQEGLIRPLASAELSDGTLRYLCLAAALLTPRPPALMVLNEPESSLHPDLLMPLARLIRHASRHTQVWVVTHSPRLIAALEDDEACNTVFLEKVFSQTGIRGQALLDRPAWHWMDTGK